MWEKMVLSPRPNPSITDFATISIEGNEEWMPQSCVVKHRLQLLVLMTIMCDFAFNCFVLFETLLVKSQFEQRTVIITIASILATQPSARALSENCGVVKKHIYFLSAGLPIPTELFRAKVQIWKSAARTRKIFLDCLLFFLCLLTCAQVWPR